MSALFLAVMGTMGSGKTTATSLLAKHLGIEILPENFAENPFLPRFYEDMHAWAFHSQLFFLSEKLSQLATVTAQDVILQDTPLAQDVYSYARTQHLLGNMDVAAWQLYERIYLHASKSLRQPDGLIYIDVSVKTAMRRIRSRGRAYEQAIPTNYIATLDRTLRQWSTSTNIPILSVQTDSIDLVRSAADQAAFLCTVEHFLDGL